MNLDLDDPLGDLLSDGSNDSLFGIEPAKKTTTVATAVPKADKKDDKSSGKKMEQLFGISEELSEPIKASRSLAYENSLSPNRSGAKVKEKLQPPKTQPGEHFETKSNDSVSTDFGFDVKKPKKKGKQLIIM
jgi:Fas-binding factor 1